MLIDDIEALLQMTPKDLRNCYKMLALSRSFEFKVKMYFDVDLHEVSQEQYKQRILETNRIKTAAPFEITER